MNVRTGGRWVRSLASAVVAALLGSALAQQPGVPDDLQALRHGSLTIWVVGPVRQKVVIPSNYALNLPTPITYKEQTAGDFGQTASSYGQNAGSVGIPTDSPSIGVKQSVGGDDAPPVAADGSGYHEETAGSFGQPASSAGTNAGSYGQNAGSFGTAASNSGTNAGNYGQTSGSFGTGLSAIAKPVAAPPLPPSRLLGLAQGVLKTYFPSLQTKFVDVPADELRPRLNAADSAESPDVLLGALPANWDAGTRRQYLLASVLPATAIADGLPPDPYASMRFSPEMSILLRSSHLREAKELALWLSEWGTDCVGCVATRLTAKETDAAGVATGAISRLVRGEGLGDLADPAMAPLPTQFTRLMLTTNDLGQADGGAARVETMHVSLNGRLAAVAVRVLVSQGRAYGVVHPLVLLRRNDAGAWKVLHVSLNLPPVDQQRAMDALRITSPNAEAERTAGVMGVKLAVPAEGDARPPQPELGWDNGGGAGLQIVEWQRAYQQGWSEARLFLVPDREPTLQTRVTATFADRDGRYRWRVWSVGNLGAMKISPWRTLLIQP
jgi:hypothetical protein